MGKHLTKHDGNVQKGNKRKVDERTTTNDDEQTSDSDTKRTKRNTLTNNESSSTHEETDDTIITTETAISSTTTTTTKKSRKKPTKGEKDLELTWICTECREAECATQPESPLLVCEGQCSRPFHYPCAGLATLPPADETWVCNDCQQQTHQCAVCHEYGADQVDVHKCEKKDCGLFFHEACLHMYDVDIQVTEIRDEAGGGVDSLTDGSLTLSVPKFQCPAHYCWACSGDMPPRAEESNNDETSSEEPLEKKGKKAKKSKKCEALSAAFRTKKERLFVSTKRCR